MWQRLMASHVGISPPPCQPTTAWALLDYLVTVHVTVWVYMYTSVFLGISWGTFPLQCRVFPPKIDQEVEMSHFCARA